LGKTSCHSHRYFEISWREVKKKSQRDQGKGSRTLGNHEIRSSHSKANEGEKRREKVGKTRKKTESRGKKRAV
jgi:hypothetical protein